MRHGDKINNLGRKTAHRHALLSNLAIELISHKRITTTLAKAKALRVYVEPLLTKSKSDTTHSRRTVFSYLQSKSAVTELFGTVASQIGDRPGGYTRIIKLSNRPGDNAAVAMIELVDFNTTYTKGDAEGANKKKRSRRGSSKSSAPKPAAANNVAPQEPIVEDAIVEDINTEEVIAETTATDVAPEITQAPEVVEEVKVEAAKEVTVEAIAPEVAPETVEEVAVEATKAEASTETDEVDPSAAFGKKVKHDDLKLVEGIGPKIEELFHNAGINTWSALAATSVERCQEILTEAGDRFAIHNPSTWPKQAEMMANGEWEALKKWQDELDGGKVADAE